MRKHYKLKTYRFNNDLIEKLKLLRKYSIVESKFVRLAIDEKLSRDLPILLKEEQKRKSKEYLKYLPF
jgi:hypothetical protein